MDKKVKTIIACVVCAILVAVVLLIFRSIPSWNVHYTITNNAGLELYNYSVYRQTFRIDGTIELENYDAGLLILTADAIDESGYSTDIFTVITITGDGVYSFFMDSFYHTNGGLIVSVENFEVEEAE